MAALAPARVVLLAILLAATVPLPTGAVEVVPDEDAQILPGPDSFGALVGDVDGDAERELVRLVPWETNPAQLAVEVISMDGGGPRSHGQQLIQRAADPDDTIEGNNRNEDPLLPMGAREPARLIAWRSDGGERVLAASIGTADRFRPCCLTLWWVSLDRDGRTELRYVQNTTSSSAWLVAADLDADGTDELAIVETPDPARPEATQVLVLRWNGEDFDRLSGSVPGLITGPLISLGDSDGLPGEEVGFVGMPSTFGDLAPTLYRIGLAGDRPVTERTVLPDAGSVLGMQGPDGGRLVLVERGEVHLLEWPAGVPTARLIRTSSRGGQPLGVLGSGEAARLLVVRGGAVDLLDAELRPRQTVASGLAAIRFRGSSWRPYQGELPGGTRNGTPAFVHGGRLVVAPTGSGQGAFRDVASLPGKTPVGLFGPGRAFAAVAHGIALPAGRSGGSLGVAAGERASQIAVVPAGALMQPEDDDGLLVPRVVGAVLDDRQAGRPILLTSSRAVAHISVPPGSVARVSGHDSAATDAEVGPAGVAPILLVEDDPDARNDETFTARLLVSTPAGHGYGATWEVRVLRRPPSLTASAPMAPLSFTVPLTGRTQAGAQLQVDGLPVELQPDGSFRAEVGAGPLPRAVRLLATDRVGNTAELTLSVVGVLDYRRLPWIPIVAGLTLLIGVLLYLRVPKPASLGAIDPDEGTLEEIQ